MHPQAPALVQHGSPRGKQALVHGVPPHDVMGAGIIIRAGMLVPELDPVPGSVDTGVDWLPAAQEPKLQT